MNSFGKLILVIALTGAVAFAILNTGVSPVSANGKLDEVLANMERAARTIRTIEADMLQDKKDMQIGGAPERYAGRIAFAHAKACDKVRIDYSKPAGQVVAVLCDEIYLYQPSIKQMIVTSRRAQASKNQEFSFIATPYKSIPELKSQYNIAYIGDEQGMAKLDLTPKSQSSVQKLTLWVDQTSWLPMKYQVIEKNNVATTFTLNNLKKNQNLSVEFKVKPAPGTKVVRQ
jgi:outer membrane lipoprotein-sorting protein